MVEVLNAEILEVHELQDASVLVIAQKTYPGQASHIDLRWLERVQGRWLNAGNDAADTIEEARLKVARYRRAEAVKRLRDERPPIADPAAHLRPFVDFLSAKRRTRNRPCWMRSAKHRVVILGEVHHRPRYWAFNADLVRSPEFARASGSHLHGASLERPAAGRPLPRRRQVGSPTDHRHAAGHALDGLAGPADARFLPHGLGSQPATSGSTAAADCGGGHGPPLEGNQEADGLAKYEVDRDQYMAENIVRDSVRTRRTSGMHCSSSATAMRC